MGASAFGKMALSLKAVSIMILSNTEHNYIQPYSTQNNIT
jgi:hypothetical protein